MTGRRAIRFSFFLPLFLAFCGVNTDKPVYHFYSVFTPVAPPTIINLVPQKQIDSGGARYRFILEYYVTNQEDGFIGYNLFITSSAASPQEQAVTTGAQPYLPRGIWPSFAHARSSPNTANSALQQQVIDYFKHPPSPVSFQTCEKYYFRMTAYTDTGIQSLSGPQKESCAILPAETAICNPSGPCYSP